MLVRYWRGRTLEVSAGPSAHECRVWIADIAMHRPRQAELLTAAEIVRIDGFVREFLADCEPLTIPQDLVTYWCRKESVVKATGAGLQVPLSQVVVSPVETAPRLLSYQGSTMPAVMFDLELPDGFVGALTAKRSRRAPLRP